MQSQDSLLTLQQVSAILHVHPNTLRRWDTSGVLRSVRLGHRKDRHYHLRAVQSLLYQNVVSTPEKRQTKDISSLHFVKTLRTMTAYMLSLHELSEIYSFFSTQIEQVLEMERCLIMTVDTTENKLVLRYTSDDPKQKLKKHISLDSDCPFIDALHNRTLSGFRDERDCMLKYPDEYEYFASARIKAHYAFPMIMYATSVGAIGIHFTKPRELSVDEQFFLQSAADICAIALDHSMHFQALIDKDVNSRKSERMLRHVNDAALHFLMNQTRSDLYNAIAAQVRSLLHASHMTILLAKDGELERVFSTSPIIDGTKVTKNGRTYRAFVQQEPFTVQVKTINDINSVQYQLGAKTLVFIPLAYNGQNIGVMNAFCTDITVLNAEELKFVKLIGSLASLALQQVEAREELQHSLKMHDLFVSFAAHEIKTPLTVISLYGQLIGKDLSVGKLPVRKHVDTLQFEVLRMTKLINELLQVSQLRSNTFSYTMKPCNLNGVIIHAIDDFKAVFPNHTALFTPLPFEPMVEGDYDKLLQIVINILNNAGKFSPTDSPISVSLTQKDGTYVISIADKGPGIAKKHLEHIFADFYKGDSKKEGMGLGLYIVKRIAMGHSGDVKIESSPKGTIVHIVLPKFS